MSDRVTRGEEVDRIVNDAQRAVESFWVTTEKWWGREISNDQAVAELAAGRVSIAQAADEMERLIRRTPDAEQTPPGSGL